MMTRTLGVLSILGLAAPALADDLGRHGSLRRPIDDGAGKITATWFFMLP